VEVTGWDIGGVNTKVARVRDGSVVAVRTHPFEFQHAPGDLPRLLRSWAATIDSPPEAVHAVTMTAELSQVFRTKREGVTCIIDAVATAFPHNTIFLYGSDGRFHAPAGAREIPLRIAAANWLATASLVAVKCPHVVLIDTGTTTTDVIPIVDGRPVPIGRTDPERLVSSELVYMGAVRTPVEAIVSHLPLAGGTSGVSAEGFALAADVHVWRGSLTADDYSVGTPDGRPKTKEHCAIRLARVVCADRDMLDDEAVSGIADAVAAAQVSRIGAAIRTVVARHRSIDTAVVTGAGAFLAAAAAASAGLPVASLSDRPGPDAAQCAPAAAVALLLAQTLRQAASS
jgi:probable H4MPT-linked C1 transfer pathway protein